MIGQRMPAARRRVGMTQEQLAKACGMTESYIAKIEGGKVKSPGILSCLKISRALATTVSELCGESAQKMTPLQRDVMNAIRKHEG